MRVGTGLVAGSPATALKRIVVAALATGVCVYMYRQAHAGGSALAAANGFGGDFRGTIWTPDRLLLRGASPYPAATDQFAIAPAVYLPPPVQQRRPRIVDHDETR